MPELTGYRADSTDQAELEKLVEVLSDSERLLDETIGAALAETDVDRAISDVLEPLGLVSCDINGLRAINRVRGFEAGDAAIAWLAQALLKCFRSDDVFRLGDDEFLAWLPVVNELAFSKRVEKLCAKILRGQVDVAFAQKWYPSWENKDIDQLIDEMNDLRIKGKCEGR